jgi:hypothetical protein
MCYSTNYIDDIKEKKQYYYTEKVFMVWIEDQGSHNITLYQSIILCEALSFFKCRRLRKVRKLQKKDWRYQRSVHVQGKKS